ncbi:unnamed protein product [Closterium sp. NIES-54]
MALSCRRRVAALPFSRPSRGPALLQPCRGPTLDSGASRSYFRDSTTLTPLSRPVAVSLADPSGGPVLAHSSTVLPCPAAPSGLLSRLHLPSFSTNLVSGADLLDAWVDQFTPGGQRVTHCTCSRTGRHLATFTRRPGSSPASAPCSYRPLSHKTLLWHHRLGDPSLPRLRGMASRSLVSGLPRSLPPLPPGPAPTCVPCVEGPQRAAPHSCEFPPTAAPLQTLHMDVWGPARVRGQGHERFFLLVVDDYSRYTTAFPLRRKGEVTEVLIDWIRGARRHLSDIFGSDLPVLRLHSDRGGEFSSDLLRAFCRAEGIRQMFTLPASPQQNGIAERCIGMVMDVARTSMIHAAAPHFLWPFAVQYAAHLINLQPRVSLPETTPTLRWTGKVGDASVFHVWGSRAFVCDSSTDKLSSRAVPCVFLGFPPDAPGWQFYHPTSRRVLSSHDVTFDESVSYYRLFPYRTTPLPPPPLFLAPGAPPVDPLPPQGPAPSGVSQVDPVEPVEVAVDSGAARGAEHVGAGPAGAGPGGAEPGDSKSKGAEPGGAEPERVEPGGAEPGGAECGGAEPERAESGGPLGVPSRQEPLSPQRLREWYARRCSRAAGATGPAAGGASGAGAARGATGAGAAGAAGPGGAGGGGTGAVVVPTSVGASGGAGAAGPEGARTGGIGAAGAGGAAEVGAEGAGAVSTRGAAGARAAGGTGVGGATGVVAGDPGAEGTVHRLSSHSRSYSGPTRGLTECREPKSRPASPESRPASPESRLESPVRAVRTGQRVPRQRPPPVPGTHYMTLRPSTAPQRDPLPSPPASSLLDGPDPESDSLHATSPTVTRFLATVVTDLSFESTVASALVAELVDFAVACRLDYAASLVAESMSASVCPLSVGGECALGTDDLEDRQEGFEYFATALPHLVSMLLALEGDPDALDIPTPRSYAEAIEGLYSYQWQTAMDTEMASWKSTGTYVDEVPPPGANIPARGDLAAPPTWLHWVVSCWTTLAALGFAPSTADPSLFLRPDTTLPPFYVPVYVDDLVFATADTQALAHVKSELQKRHTCTDLGELTIYLGLRITQDRAQCTITLTQSHMVQQVLQRFGFTYSSPQSTPLPTGHSLSAPPSEESVEPSGPKEHMDAAKRVLRYLCSTLGMGLVLGGWARVVLTGHANASWADDLTTQHSSQGYTFSLGSGSVSWRSTRSSSVLSSSCEVEIYAGAMAAQELRWLTYLLTDLGEPPCSPPVLYVDNKAMIALCQEHRLEHRTKHIALRYFLARELQQRG